MINHNLSASVKATRVRPNGAAYAVAAGTGDTLTSDAIPVLGFGAVELSLAMGAIAATAVVTAKLLASDTSGGVYTEVEGSERTIADNDDNKVVGWDLYHPRSGFFKVEVTRETANAAIDCLIVRHYHAANVPVTHDPTTVKGDYLVLNAPKAS